VRSRPDRRVARLVAVLTLTALCAAGRSVRAAAAQPEPVPATAGTIEAADVASAIDLVKKDPNLAPERTMKVLRWKGSGSNPPGTSRRMNWIAGLFEWIAQSARVLVWCTVIVLVVMLAGYIARAVRTYGLPRREERFVAPTHVRDLDIRPETLPADIGGTARGLWDRGEQRAALALLYRGLLSRLVHVHRVAIRDSSTEGDCLRLASQQLTAARLEYASRLIGAWQRSVYGREIVGSDAVHALCDEFAAMLDRAGSAAIASEAAA
jgi:hypothetical protein